MSYLKITKTVALLASLALTAQVGHAQLLYSTDFSSPQYADGNLVGQDSWAVTSGTTNLIQVSNTASDGVITLVHGSGGREDANRNVGSTIGATDLWLATFDVSVSGGSTAVYFAHFLANSTSFTGRVFVTPLTGSDFTFGISSSGGAADSVFASGFSFDTVYTLTAGYDRATGLSSLAIGNTTITSTTESFLAVNSFGFRQSSGNSTQVIDNLSVTAIPEPGTVAMLAIGLVLVLWRLRSSSSVSNS